MSQINRVINIVRATTLDFGIPSKRLLEGMQEYVSSYIAFYHGIDARLRFADKGDGEALWLIDTDAIPGILGMHDVSPLGYARGYVDVAESLSRGENVSVAVGHELAEMLLNPMGSEVILSPRGNLLAFEIVDPVQGLTFPVSNGVEVPDFTLPSWWGLGGPYNVDQMGLLSEPFQLHPSGYVPIYRGGSWSEMFGSQAAMERQKAKPPGLHRHERYSRGHNEVRLAQGSSHPNPPFALV